MAVPHNKGFTDKDVAQVLLNARALMNNRGKHWIIGKLRGKNKDGEQCYCSVGAILAAAPGDQNKALRKAAFKALADFLRNDPKTANTFQYYDDDKSVIIRNNDQVAPGRGGWKHINSVFRGAAKVAASTKRK